MEHRSNQHPGSQPRRNIHRTILRSILCYHLEFCPFQEMDNWRAHHMDSVTTGFNTTHEFTSLHGKHTFTVPPAFSNSTFKQWDTGETSASITLSSAGTHTAQAIPGSRTVTPGQSTTYQVTAPQGGYAGSVVWQYFGSLTTGFAVASIPLSINPNNPTVDTSTATVSTTTQSEPGTSNYILKEQRWMLNSSLT